MNELLSIDEVARLLGVSRSTAYNWARSGVLPVVRVANVIRVPEGALEEWRLGLEREALAGIGRTEPVP